jgi:predicted alpha/beta superfamily hydrolase
MRRVVFPTLAMIVLVTAASTSCSESETPGGAAPGDVMTDAATPRADSTPPVTTPPSTDSGTDSEAAPETCTPRDTDSPPKTASYPMKLAGQDAWIHDEKSPAGYFNTYDALAVGTGAQMTPRKVHVFLPRDYPGSCKRYPVVYMNDGDTAFFAGSVGKTWDVQGVLSTGYAAGSFGEVIVVAVHPLERDREYTHAAWLTGRSCCEVPAYVTYLASAIKPFIDSAYRTRADAKSTTVVGSSHGGLAAFYTASKRPEVFGNAIAMSSSFWAGLDELTIGGPLSTSALMTAAGPGLTSKKPRIYLDWGLVRTGGTHNSLIEDRATARGTEMASLLVSAYGYTKDKDLFTVEDPQGEHEENSWHRRFGNALKLVLGP